jgi:hypothetical protein
MKNKHISFTLNILTMTSHLMKINISQSFFIFLILYLFYNVFFIFLIVYLYYNGDLLKIFKKLLQRIVIINFVNDINFLMYDIFTKQNCWTLKHFHQKCETWNRLYEIVFALIKYKFVHLTRNYKKLHIQI